MVSADCGPTSASRAFGVLLGELSHVEHLGKSRRSREPGELFEGRYLGDAGTANGYEEPVNWARIAVLIAAALPVFGGLYYWLLNFLLFG